MAAFMESLFRFTFFSWAAANFASGGMLQSKRVGGCNSIAKSWQVNTEFGGVPSELHVNQSMYSQEKGPPFTVGVARDF